MQLTEQNLRAMLERFKAGELSEEKMLAALKNISLTAVEELGFASIDHQRELRQGTGNLIATRVSEEKFEYVRADDL